MREMRLDEDKLEALRAWGQGLRQAENEELSATGRAILMLVDEIDRLYIELWHARLPASSVEPAVDEQTVGHEEEPVGPALQGRLRRALRRGSAPAVEPRPEAEPGEEAAHSWIESLRRQG